MGLFDSLFSDDDPAKQGQLMMALSLMQGTRDKGLLGNLATAGMAGMQGAAGARDAALKRKLLEAQIGSVDEQTALRKQQEELAKQKADWQKNFWGEQSAPSSLPGFMSPNSMTPNQPTSGNSPAFEFLPGKMPSAQPKSSPTNQSSRFLNMSFDDAVKLQSNGFMPDAVKHWTAAREGIGMDVNKVYKNVDTGEQSWSDPKLGLQLRNGLLSQMPGSEAIANLEGAKSKSVAESQLPANTYMEDLKNFNTARTAYQEVLGDGSSQFPVVGRKYLVNKAEIGGMTRPQLPGQFQQNQGDPQGGMPTAEQMAKILAYEASQGKPVDLNSARFNFFQNQSPRNAPAFATAEAPADPIEQATKLKQATLNPEAIASSNKYYFEKVLPEIADNAKSAKSTINNVATLRNIDFNTSATAPVLSAFGNALIAAGVGSEKVQKYVSGAQGFDAIATAQSLTESLKQKGTQTEADATRINKTMPRLTNTNDAKNFLLDVLEANAKMEILKNDHHQAMRTKGARGGLQDFQSIEDSWNKKMSNVSIFDMPSMQKWAK